MKTASEPNTGVDTELQLKQESDLMEIVKKLDCKEYKYEFNQFEAEVEDDDTIALRAEVPSPVFFYHPDHLGSSTVISNSTGAMHQYFFNLPFGETMIEGCNNTSYQLNYKFNGKELDAESNMYYYGARYYDPMISVWMSVDQMTTKHPNYTSYAYVNNNPLGFIDPIGMDTVVFSANNKYSHTIKSDGVHVGKKLGKEGFIFNFSDPDNDPKNIGNKPGQINELYIPGNKKMLKDLDRAGVNEPANKGLIDGPLYLKNHSHSGKNAGELDFIVKSEIFGSYVLGDEKLGYGLPANFLYITEVGKNHIGHNNYNFGNFLWGAAANALGVFKGDALMGAHINNYLNDANNQGKSWYERSFDSSDDQYSIGLGWQWRNSINK